MSKKVLIIVVSLIILSLSLVIFTRDKVSVEDDVNLKKNSVVIEEKDYKFRKLKQDNKKTFMLGNSLIKVQIPETCDLNEDKGIYDFDCGTLHDYPVETPYLGKIRVYKREEIEKIAKDCQIHNQDTKGEPYCLFYYTPEIYDKQAINLEQETSYKSEYHNKIEYKKFNGRGFLIRTTPKPFVNMRLYTTIIDAYLVEIDIDAYDRNFNGNDPKSLLDEASDELFSYINFL